jgi:hypothetical protein
LNIFSKLKKFFLKTIIISNINYLKKEPEPASPYAPKIGKQTRSLFIGPPIKKTRGRDALVHANMRELGAPANPILCPRARIRYRPWPVSARSFGFSVFFIILGCFSGLFFFLILLTFLGSSVFRFCQEISNFFHT